VRDHPHHVEPGGRARDERAVELELDAAAWLPSRFDGGIDRAG
jgi:hypothetical protein